MRKLLLTAGVALLALASTANAHGTGCRPGLNCTNVQTMTTQWLCQKASRHGCAAKKKRPVCKPHYVRRTVKVHRHGKTVRQIRCVRVKPKTTSAPTIPAPAAIAPTAVRAGIDPSYTQDPTDNLKVTWTYSASSTDVPLPAGTLSLTVQEPNKAGSSGGCTMNVGDTVTGGTCTQELPHYGSWNVTVSYTGASTTIAPASSTDTEDIEPLPVPAPAPPAATTTTTSVSYGTPYTNVGPPPTNIQSQHVLATVTAASTAPSIAYFTVTITDQATGQSVTGPPQSGNTCDIDLMTVLNDPQSPPNGETGCGISAAFPSSDAVAVTTTTSGSAAYMPSTSAPVALWPSP